jgi:hypothetical protein
MTLGLGQGSFSVWADFSKMHILGVNLRFDAQRTF